MAQFRRIIAISFLEALDDAIMDVLKVFNPVAPTVPNLLEVANRRAEALTKLQSRLFEARKEEQEKEREGQVDPEEERRIDLETDREVEAMTGYGPKEITALSEKARGDVAEITAAVAREDVIDAPTVAPALPLLLCCCCYTRSQEERQEVSYQEGFFCFSERHVHGQAERSRHRR